MNAETQEELNNEFDTLTNHLEDARREFLQTSEKKQLLVNIAKDLSNKESQEVARMMFPGDGEIGQQGDGFAGGKGDWPVVNLYLGRAKEEELQAGHLPPAFQSIERKIKCKYTRI